MKYLNNFIDRFCYNHPRFGIPNLVYYLIGGSCVVYLLDLLTYSRVAVSSLLAFDRALIFQGQIWRLVTFLFTTWGQNPVSFLPAWSGNGAPPSSPATTAWAYCSPCCWVWSPAPPLRHTST